MAFPQKLLRYFALQSSGHRAIQFQPAHRVESYINTIQTSDFHLTRDRSKQICGSESRAFINDQEIFYLFVSNTLSGKPVGGEYGKTHNVHRHHGQKNDLML